MSLTVMTYGQIRDLVSNLGCRDQNDAYLSEYNCLKAIENLEEALLNEDVNDRNVRIGIHICEAVTKDLIPIIVHQKDPKVLAVTIRVLVSLSLPVEYLVPLEDAKKNPKTQSIRNKLMFFSLAVKRAFLDASATLSLVSMLRESIIKSEKHAVPLNEEECNHLRNCLLLLRNLLHIPEDTKLLKESCLCISDWQSLQKKLIWNIFVQGIDGAFLLMLKSKYRTYWIEPLAFILALLYKNQNASKICQVIDTISSASESSDDEESDGSKNSSASLSSEPMKDVSMSDSGYPLSDVSLKDPNKNTQTCENSSVAYTSMDIQAKLQRVQLAEDDENLNPCSATIPPKNIFAGKAKQHASPKDIYNSEGSNSEGSSSSESPLHKKMKSNYTEENIHECNKNDSGLSENTDEKLSDDDFSDKKSSRNLKTHKTRNAQIQLKALESDSSNEGRDKKNTKHRNPPPVGWRSKSPRRNGCNPSICMTSALQATSNSKQKVRYPLWEKRNSVSTLVDFKSPVPSDDEIRNLQKEFTLSFMHCGFSEMVMDLKNFILKEQLETVDKSLFFWILSYFVQLAANIDLNFEHMSNIFNSDVIGYLVFECILACENIELHSKTNLKISKYLSVHLSLLVSALKEMINAIEFYCRKNNSHKEKMFFNNLCGKLAGFQDLRHLPLLLFHNCPKMNTRKYLEDVVILNHQIMTISERGIDSCWESRRINMITHLKLFSTSSVISCYGKLLQNFKANSQFLNECIFTMLHHVAGDIHSSQLLFETSILKTFSMILQEDLEIKQYQEDLIMYILNKFSMQRKRKSLKKNKTENYQDNDSSNGSTSSCSSISNSCLLSEDDDLFWWFLQFEQDADPISRISEHVPFSKQEILSKLLFKGIISSERHKQFEESMKSFPDQSIDLIQKDEIVQAFDFDDGLTTLMRTLVQAGARQHLMWVQDTLLETCYVKLGFAHHPPEYVAYYSLKMMLAVPLIPYTEEQRRILQDDIFCQLLQKIGFSFDGVYQIYPRIPLLWDAGLLFTIAARLGPIQKDKLKFTYEDVVQANHNPEPAPFHNMPCPALPPLSSCCTLSSWLTAVQQSKETYKGPQVQK